MGYESFDGGSHGTHEWVAIGHERVQQRDGSKVGTLGWLLPDRFYVIRACQLCREVWWQEYDITAATR